MTAERTAVRTTALAFQGAESEYRTVTVSLTAADGRTSAYGIIVPHPKISVNGKTPAQVQETIQPLLRLFPARLPKGKRQRLDVPLILMKMLW